MLCYSKDGLYTSLTTLPSEALQTEALKLFKVKWERSPGPLAGGTLAMCPGSAWSSSAHCGDTWVEGTQAVRGKPTEGSEEEGKENPTASPARSL